MKGREITKKPKKYFVHIVVTEMICTAIILLAVLVTKYFFKETFSQVKDWYQENFYSDTSINEVLK